jgi:hypothetical protein
VQFAAMNHVRTTEFLPRSDQAIGHAEALAQPQRFGLLGEKGVGSALDDEIVDPFGANGSAEPRACFEQTNVDAPSPVATELNETMRGRQSRNSTADHGDPRHDLIVSHHWVV